MKKIKLCTLLMILSLKVQAQLTNGNFTDEVDYRLQNINKTPITSNILMDRVFPVAAIQIFNQGSRIDTSSYSHFKQAWSELYRASYTKNFATLQQLKTQIQNNNYQENEVPLGIINTEFHQGNYGTTVQNANVDFNPTTGLFANKSGRNPFVKKQTSIISPLISKVTGSTIQFKTDNLFKLYKYGKQIKTLQLSTNGSNFMLINNYSLGTGNFVTNYSTSGTKDLRFTITYSDNTTKTTHAKVYVEVPDNYYAKSSTFFKKDFFADSDLAFQGYEAGDQPILGKNEYRIYYNDDNEIINKPIYIIDGYDPNDTRKIEKNDTGHTSDKSIRELMSYDHDNNDNTPKKDLVKDLNAKGYDVIIVNHPVNPDNGIDGGSDYIERNAYTFISLMRHIKSIQQGTEKAVVIGPSMGGLITRYALAYMEKKYAETGLEKWNHNTRLWVSFDAPHQGANIPIGVQKGIQFFAEEQGVESAQEFIDKQLDKPAPKQMLVNHYTNDTNLPVGAPNFRNRFQNELDALGMPQNLRKIALNNGSIMGALNGISKGKYLNIDDNLTHISPLFYPNPVVGTVHTVLTNIFFDKLVADFYHSTNNKYGNEEHFTFDGGLKGKFLWWSWYTTRTSFKSISNSKGSFDIAPGGHFNAQGLLANQSEQPDDGIEVIPFTLILHNLNTNVIDPTHSFIPTKSALAYTGSNVLDEVIGKKNRVCTGETPFDSYFAPQKNEEHIHLTNENVTWLKEELNFDTPKPPPTVYLTAEDLKGANRICSTDTETYSFANCVFPNPVWQVSSNLQILSSNSTSITVKPINSNTSGYSFIKATANNKVLQKNIHIGKPEIEFIVFNNNNEETDSFCTDLINNTYQIETNQNNIISHDIRILDLNFNVKYSSNYPLPGKGSVLNYRPNTGFYIFQARITDACGTSNWFETEIEFLECGNKNGGEEYNYNIAPNPVKSNTINILEKKQSNRKRSYNKNDIAFKRSNKIKSKTNFITLELYNRTGVLVNRKKAKKMNTNNSFNLIVQDLKNGIYILKIIDNSHVENHQIIIEK